MLLQADQPIGLQYSHQIKLLDIEEATHLLDLDKMWEQYESIKNG